MEKSKRRRKLRESLIYVWKCEAFVKIGFTTDPASRLHCAATASPFEIIPVCTFVGRKDDERRLHLFFSQHRHRGEWFRDEGSVASFLRAMQNAVAPDGTVEKEAVYEWLVKAGAKLTQNNHRAWLVATN